MIEVKGKYNSAKIYTDNIEKEALSQIIELCNQEFCKDSKIRIMPDVHAGAGCTIGTTMTIKDKIVPNLVGVDIGCGMYVCKLKEKEIDLRKLDEVIREYIPSGFNIRVKEHKYIKNVPLKDLACEKHINLERAMLSVGTLGGGNHFIEVNKDSDENLYLVIHSGSRCLGKQVAEYYQNLGYKHLTDTKKEKEVLIKKLKSEGRQKDIHKELARISKPKINKSLAYITGIDMKYYINDMQITQSYATWNRKAIADEIIKNMNLTLLENFTTIHNYIDIEKMILRKGAISAKEVEKVIIPMNMRDGSLICIGKGNSEWNCSAPHGAGRIMSRSKAKKEVSLNEFKNSMKDIYTTSVNQNTIDESPMVYKPMEEIIRNIHDTVDVLQVIKPIYNFKAN